LRTPLKTITDSGGLASPSITRYDATTGLPTESRMPGAATAGGDAATSDTVYYTAGTNSLDSACGNHPEWANLACKTKPAAQPGTAGLPDLPTSWVSSYDYLNRSLVAQQTVNTTTRTTTSSYLNSGWGSRQLSTALSGGTGTTVPTSTTSYDASTGLPVTISASGTSENPATSSTTGYDDFGRAVSYSENDQATGAAANTVTTTFDTNTGRVSSVQDAHSTRTNTYNGGSDYRDLVTSMAVHVAGSTAYDGTYTVSYDSNGSPLTQTDPNGVTTTLSRDENNQLVKLTATKSGSSWLTDTATPNIYGEWLLEANDAGRHHYSYDTLGRLSAADNTPTGGACASRSYTFNNDSNRLSLNSYGAASDGSSCQNTTGVVTTSHSYDIADRLTDTGVGYDAYGRITTLPAADTSNGVVLNSGYYVNDLVRSQTQGSTSMCWSLDPSQRLREATTYSSSSCTGTVTKDTTSHYDDPSSDSPDWTAENAAQTNWTMNVSDLIGGLGITIDQTGTPTYNYTNLHGDTLATAAGGASSPIVSTDYDEYGNPTDHQTRRYGWLGEKQRSGDDLGGNLLMGVRVYNPLLGRFLSVDPVPGGSANDYDYAYQDPINNSDLDGRCAVCFVGLGGVEAVGAADWWNPVGWTIAGGLAAYGGYKAYKHYSGGSHSSSRHTSAAAAYQLFRKGERASETSRNTNGKSNGGTRHKSKKEAEEAARQEAAHGGRCSYRGTCSSGNHVHADYYNPQGKITHTSHHSWISND
jgi:RHS repeat-associated protein